jgi:hypothetical protein
VSNLRKWLLLHLFWVTVWHLHMAYKGLFFLISFCGWGETESATVGPGW